MADYTGRFLIRTKTVMVTCVAIYCYVGTWKYGSLPFQDNILAAEKCVCYVMSRVSADRNNNRSKTLTSFVVISEYESSVTQTVITSRCVVTDLITTSVVLKTFVNICV